MRVRTNTRSYGHFCLWTDKGKLLAEYSFYSNLCSKSIFADNIHREGHDLTAVENLVFRVIIANKGNNNNKDKLIRIPTKTIIFLLFTQLSNFVKTLLNETEEFFSTDFSHVFVCEVHPSFGDEICAFCKWII